MNIIHGDILLAMDSVYAGIIYSSVVESSHYRWLKMHLQLNAVGNLSLKDYMSTEMANKTSSDSVK